VKLDEKLKDNYDSNSINSGTSVASIEINGLELTAQVEEINKKEDTISISLSSSSSSSTASSNTTVSNKKEADLNKISKENETALLNNNKETSNSINLLIRSDSKNSETNNATKKLQSSSSTSIANSTLFSGVIYLGCASVNAPKSETEINRIMSTLNEQGKVAIEVKMSIPKTIEEKIVLFESLSESKIAEYRMAQVLFVVRGQKNSPENSCFAFTTCHGDSPENLMFSCHVFRCNLVDAVSKILYLFWSAFNNQKIQMNNQKRLSAANTNESSTGSSSTNSSTGQLSSLLGSLYGSLPQVGQNVSALMSSNSSNASNSNQNVNYNAPLADYAINYVNGSREDQYIFRATLEIKEEDPKNPSNYLSVPKEKEFFKLRKNLNKQINIQIQQLTNQPLEIERCFGILMCPGRNVSHKDMQLLNTISMGKTGAYDSSSSSTQSSTTSSANSGSSSSASTAAGSGKGSGGMNTASTSPNSGAVIGASGYLVSALWDLNDQSILQSMKVLNEETNKNMRVFMTIAVDLVLNGLQDPVRFCIETKARVYPQSEKFWVYPKTKHYEEFYLQICKNNEDLNDALQTNVAVSKPSIPGHTHLYNLHSIFSQTELIRKKNTVEHQKKIEEENAKKNNQSATTNEASGAKDGGANEEEDDDENEIVMSGLGNVSKDCAEEELSDWSDLLGRWRKTTWNERPRGLQTLVRKGIPEALRGEVWQLLAGCNENEKSMNESYRLLLSKESSSENVILRDINRTFPGHQFFQDENGQQALYKLSKAYSIYDEEVGYCQGLSFLIASLLLHMPEEQTFNLLVKIMYKYELREIYKTNFECLHLRFFQLENLIREHLPELYEHFVDLNIEAHM
jgi:Rab GTPase-activating protein 1